SSLLSVAEFGSLATELGMDESNPWERFDPTSAEGKLCIAAADRLQRDPIPATKPPNIPLDIGRTPKGTATTQAALGRVLLDLTREAPEAARRIVTVSPDVSSTTNLGGWVNKVGVCLLLSATTGLPMTPRRSCTGGRSPAASTWSLVSPRQISLD